MLKVRVLMSAVSFPQLLTFTTALLLLPIASVRAEDPQLVTLVQRGDVADSEHRTTSALASFVEAERLAPNRPEVLLRISKQYSDLVDTARNPAEAQAFAARALSYARRSVEAAPENAKAHLSLAIAYGKLTDFVNSKTRLEYSKIIKAETVKSIALDPTDDFAFHVLGRWHYGVANLNPMLRMMAKVVYGGLPDASNEEAVRNLQRAAELAPQRMMHRSELAKAYIAIGKKELARREWKAVLQLPAGDAEEREMQRSAQQALKE
jgi:hypothetical protein